MAQIFTDDREELLRAMCRPDDPMSATNLAESTKQQPPSTGRQPKFLSTAAQLTAAAQHYREVQQQGKIGQSTPEREMDHD